jgi:hypothetical protein
MKKLVFVLIITFMVIGTVSAQAVNISGTLQLQNGAIAVVSGNNTYFVPILTRYIGFIEGLKEGAQISVNGFVFGNSIQPNNVTIAGKTYDFASNNQQSLAQGGYGQGYCGGGNYRGGGWGQHCGGFGRNRMW